MSKKNPTKAERNQAAQEKRDQAAAKVAPSPPPLVQEGPAQDPSNPDPEDSDTPNRPHSAP